MHRTEGGHGLCALCRQLLASRGVIVEDRQTAAPARTDLLYLVQNLAWTASLGTRITGPQTGAAGEAWGCLAGA